MPENEQKFQIQRVYVKSSSFVLKDAPAIFHEKGASENKMELKLDQKKLKGDHLYEVTLDIQITTVLKDKEKTKEKEAFVVQVQQSGIFHLEGFEEKQQEHLLGAYCPEVLYPYARHVIAELIVMSGLPPVVLMPMNFEGLYKQAQKERQKQQSSKDKKDIVH